MKYFIIVLVVLVLLLVLTIVFLSLFIKKQKRENREIKEDNNKLRGLLSARGEIDEAEKVINKGATTNTASLLSGDTASVVQNLTEKSKSRNR